MLDALPTPQNCQWASKFPFDLRFDHDDWQIWTANWSQLKLVGMIVGQVCDELMCCLQTRPGRVQRAEGGSAMKTDVAESVTVQLCKCPAENRVRARRVLQTLSLQSP